MDNSWPRRRFLSSALAATTVSRRAAPNQPRSGARPNIIFLLADDQRWDSLGCTGNPVVRTPHLDGLARAGTVFENNFVTTSICMCSRASILTGLYSRCHRIHDFRTSLAPEISATSYPALLRKSGYRTGFIGKYGVGETLPEHEFDFFDGFAGQGHYFPKQHKGRHLTSLQQESALSFLRSCPRSQPFCLSISFKAPHVQDEDPRQYLYDPADAELFHDATMPVPTKASRRWFDSLPDFLKATEGRRRWQLLFSTPEKYQQSVKGYYRLIVELDRVVGRIRKELDTIGCAENTVILFTSDNGFFLGEYGLSHKWFMYEESIRTPLIVYDPRADGAVQGARRGEMTLNIDVAPTILDVAGVPIPPGVQGRSLKPLLAGGNPPWRSDWFYEHLFAHPAIPRSEGVRTDRWKYIRYIDRDPVHEEMYDLQNDAAEEHNLVAQPSYRQQAQRLRERWRLWRSTLEMYDRGRQWSDPG